MCAEGDFCAQKRLFKGNFWSKLISSIVKLHAQNLVSDLRELFFFNASKIQSHFYEDKFKFP